MSKITVGAHTYVQILQDDDKKYIYKIICLFNEHIYEKSCLYCKKKENLNAQLKNMIILLRLQSFKQKQQSINILTQSVQFDQCTLFPTNKVVTSLILVCTMGFFSTEELSHGMYGLGVLM